MSPELERLLNALWELNTCEPKDRARWKATLDRLTKDALAARPGTTAEQLFTALMPRYQAFQRARRKHPTLPPKA